MQFGEEENRRWKMEKRKAKSEKRKAKSEKRKAKSEKRKAKSEETYLGKFGFEVLRPRKAGASG
jgi:hypothetical protein